jgi:hypothetical protein
MTRLRETLAEAETFVTLMPTDKVGLLFLKGDHVVQPDPAHLGDYQTHAGRKRGQWPSSAEITSAMIERYKKQPAHSYFSCQPSRLRNSVMCAV